MLKVGLISALPPRLWLRYFPNQSPIWNGIEFKLSGDVSDCDIVVVFDEIPKIQCGDIRAQNSIFLATEPPSIKTYNEKFLSQFDIVYTVDQSSRHPNVIFGHVPTLWHIGVWDENGNQLDNAWNYSDFERFQPTKKKSLSIITSNKAYTVGHRKRIEFAENIKNYFGDEVDLFGRGRRSFGDKVQVIPEYRYHIAIENSAYVDYWTEKLSDTVLSLTYPIYSGCPNIKEYFSKDEIIFINPRDIDGSLRSIKIALESDRAETSIESMINSRKKVLNQYNIINLISKLCAEAIRLPIRKRNTLFSEFFFTRGHGKIYGNATAILRAARRSLSPNKP